MTASKTAAAKAEATDETVTVTVTFTFDEVEYTIPPATEWDVDTLEAIEAGMVTTACRAILGDDGWAAFKATKPKAKHLGELFEAIGAAAGISGN